MGLLDRRTLLILAAGSGASLGLAACGAGAAGVESRVVVYDGHRVIGCRGRG